MPLRWCRALPGPRLCSWAIGDVRTVTGSAPPAGRPVHPTLLVEVDAHDRAADGGTVHLDETGIFERPPGADVESAPGDLGPSPPPRSTPAGDLPAPIGRTPES